MKSSLKYEYQPLKFIFDEDKRKRPNIYLNFSLYSSCSDSYGVFIFIELTLFYKVWLCIKPIGEISCNAKC